MCSSGKYPYSPHRRDWNFLGGGGSVRPKNLKKCMKLNWNFQRGGGGEKKSLPWEVWTFSGITQCCVSHMTFCVRAQERELKNTLHVDSICLLLITLNAMKRTQGLDRRKG